MHTTEIDIEHLKEITDLRIHHNGDWSGDAIVVWKSVDEDEHHEVCLPAVVLIAVTRAASFENIRDRLISFLEEIEHPRRTARKKRPTARKKR